MKVNSVIIAIDGACKRNGKPDCISAGSAFIKRDDGTCTAYAKVEEFSTNQRGELLGLILGLSAGVLKRNVLFVTDSEYIYNALTKDWITAWIKKGWVTANNTPVKNRDLWENINSLLQNYDMDDFGIIHIKGHIVTVGPFLASKLIEEDPSYRTLYNHIKLKMEHDRVRNHDKIEKAIEVFHKNHGYEPPMDKFNEIVVCNTVVDTIASYALAKHLSN